MFSRWSPDATAFQAQIDGLRAKLASADKASLMSLDKQRASSAKHVKAMKEHYKGLIAANNSTHRGELLKLEERLRHHESNVSVEITWIHSGA